MTALLAPFPKFRAEDSSGASLPGALLYTYVAGTTTPLATCKDSTGAVFNTNPVVCDSGGQADVWLTAGVSYKFVLQSSVGVVQWTVDNITGGLQGTAGAPGSTWTNGTGAPSNAVGSNGDYYLDTATGDVYKKSGGAYAIVGNIKGPAGATRNVISNGTFYNGLSPWITTGVNAPTLGTGHTAQLGAARELAQQSTGAAVTSVGSINQSFSIQTPSGTQNITFNTACYYESVAAAIANSGYVKAYVYDGSAGTETLVGTYNMTATSSTPSWVARTIDLTAYLPAAGDYGVRFEIQAYCDNSGGSAGTKGTITAVDDVVLNLVAAGAAGPTGPAGPQGLPGSSSGVLQRVVITGTQTWTVPVSVNYLDVTCVGGGLGGGSNGGASGAVVRRRIQVTPNTGYTVTIGAASAGSMPPATPSAAGDTSFGTLVVAKGATAWNAPGTGSSLGYTGGTIDTALTTTARVFLDGFGAGIAGGTGGGNGNPGTGSAGSAGTDVETFAGGTGGAGNGATTGGGGGGAASAFGKGGNGAVSGGAAATAATGYGAGGGGGTNGATNSQGASGSPGVCIIEYVG